MSSVRTCRTAAGPGTPAGTGSTDAQLRALIAVLKARGIRTGVEVGGTAWSAGPPPAGTPRPPGPPPSPRRALLHSRDGIAALAPRNQMLTNPGPRAFERAAAALWQATARSSKR